MIKQAETLRSRFLTRRSRTGADRPILKSAAETASPEFTSRVALEWLVATLWLGLVAGWLELGLVLVQRSINPHIPLDLLRTNRHYLWMIPVADTLLFAVLGLILALLGRPLPKLTPWLAPRLPLTLLFWTLLLNIDGLNAASSLVFSAGLGAMIGPRFGRRIERVRPIMVVSLSALGPGLLILTALTVNRIQSAENRARSLAPVAKAGAPNVVLIVLDNVRAASLSLYGHDRPTSPNLERLARSGLLYKEARSTASWTLPSHASLLTGRWPHELSVGFDLPLDATYPTLAEVLGRHGYASAGFVANTYYCNLLYGLGRGFDRYEDDYENQTISLFEILRSSGLGKRLIHAFGYSIRVAEGGTSVRKSAAMINRDALRWIAGVPEKRPFFVFLNYYDAHGPWVPPDNLSPRFGLGASSEREKVEILKRHQAIQSGKLDADEATRQAAEREAVNVLRDSYESCIASLDHQIGLLHTELERRGLMENTLVIITSDHGEHFQERGFRGHGLSLYRREVHVPLLILPPAKNATTAVIDEPVSHRDIAATIADWAGLGAQSPFPGHSLRRSSGGVISPVLSELERQPNLAPMQEVPASLGSVRSLLSGNLEYIHNGNGAEELYRLDDDPFESRNLAPTAEAGPRLIHFRADLKRLSGGERP